MISGLAIGMRGIDFPLYLVTDRTQTRGRALVPLLREAMRVGLRAVQLRERDLPTHELMNLARELLPPSREAGAHVLVNDRLDVAMALDTSGVHLRSNSLPVDVARRMLGPDRLIGVSAHSRDEVVQAEEQGADFVVLGPVYATQSKDRYGPPIGLRPLEDSATRCRIPVFAIGGMTPARVRDVRRAGAFGVAVVSSILAAQDVEAATRALLDAVMAPL